VEPIIRKLGGGAHPLLPGKRLKLLDGNCLEKNEHRLKELRMIAAGPLPGKSLVVYDPELRLPIDVFPCEDGFQERLLLKEVFTTIQTNDVWVADRNFCTVEFTFEIASRAAFFAIREHKQYPFELLGREKFIGKIETGTVYEQPILVRAADGAKQYPFRRIRVKLKKQTRDSDTHILINSNLSMGAANAKTIARLYRDCWTIQSAFQKLAQYLNSEINTWGYPRAALFGFCVALVAYAIMSVILAALASVHGVDVIEQQLSGYYVANEISGIYLGMMIAIDYDHWTVFRQMALSKLVKVLQDMAAKVKLSAFQRRCICSICWVWRNRYWRPSLKPVLWKKSSRLYSKLLGSMALWRNHHHGVCGIDHQSSGEQADGEKATDALEPARGPLAASGPHSRSQ
jgi:IS4 transposase